MHFLPDVFDLDGNGQAIAENFESTAVAELVERHALHD